MKTNLKIGQRVAKSKGNLGYKVGIVKEIKNNRVLVDFDKHDNRWVSVSNLELIS